MDPYARTKEALCDHRNALNLRIRRIESVARQHGFSCIDVARDLTPNPILKQFLTRSCDEAAKAMAAIQRLERMEFDCCIMCGRDIDSAVLERYPYSVNCTVCVERFPTNYADNLRIQHSNLTEIWISLLDVTSQVCTRVQQANPASAEICACVAIFDCLQSELADHFEMESDGGYLRPALDAAPRFSGKARNLERQHGEFVARMRLIRSKVAEAPPFPLPWSQIQLDLQSLIKDLIYHENAENEILSAAFLDDTGGEG